jgi:hypothetical protein
MSTELTFDNHAVATEARKNLIQLHVYYYNPILRVT